MRKLILNRVTCNQSYLLVSLIRRFSSVENQITKNSDIKDVNSVKDVNGNGKPEKIIRVAIIGSPNAGKSSFINTITNHRVSINKST